MYHPQKQIAVKNVYTHVLAIALECPTFLPNTDKMSSIMQEYIDFALSHPFLSGTWVVLLVAFLAVAIRQSANAGRRVSRHEATLIANRQKGLWVDIRDEAAYQQGHIAGAWHFDLKTIVSGEIAKLEKQRQRPVILVCESGMRSGKAAGALAQKGFEQVYILDGGMQGWISERLPVSK